MRGQHRSPLLAVTGLLIGLVVAAFLSASCSTTSVQRAVVVPPSVPGASFIGNGQCYDCHTNYARSFQGNVHFRLHVDVEKKPGGTSCESCHGPGSLHAAAPRDRATLIVNPRKDPQACFSCHDSTLAKAHMEINGGTLYGPRSVGLGTTETCMVCHEVGRIGDIKAVHKR